MKNKVALTIVIVIAVLAIAKAAYDLYHTEFPALAVAPALLLVFLIVNIRHIVKSFR